MMEVLHYIVQRLNDKPFNLSIRAVELEEQTPAERLQLLIDVASTLNEELKADVSIEPNSNSLVEKLVQFLTLHHCKLVPQNESELEEFSNGIADGANTLSILHFVLSNYEYLKKRCYLANYLMPINLPEEYTRQDSNLVELLESYRDLQSEFIEIHKEYDRVASAGGSSAADLIAETKQLLQEKKQLLERLRREENQVRGNAVFEQLLSEICKLREAQDEEIRLTDQKRDQNQLLSAATQRLEQVRNLSNILHSLSNSSEVELDVKVQQSILDYEMIFARKQHESQVKLAEAKKQDPCRGVDEMEAMAMDLEDKLESKLIELDEASRSSIFSLENINRYRMHVDVAATKVKTKQQILMSKELEKSIAAAAFEKVRIAFDDQSCSEKMQELEQLRLDLKCQTKAYQEAKKEVVTMQQENTDLNETKMCLEKELNDFEASLKDQEEDAGVIGFHNVNAELEHISSDTSALNEAKSQTLVEISNVVQQIALVLATKQKELEPKVQDLKNARERFKEFQERFNSERALYEQLALKTKRDNDGLEQEHIRLQTAVAEKETMHERLRKSNETLKANIQCCESEDVGDLENTLSHQEVLLDDLRRQHAEIQNSKEHNVRQDILFSNLMKLLELIEV
jgi:intraflagellar transport protein 81